MEVLGGGRLLMSEVPLYPERTPDALSSDDRSCKERMCSRKELVLVG